MQRCFRGRARAEAFECPRSCGDNKVTWPDVIRSKDFLCAWRLVQQIA